MHESGRRQLVLGLLLASSALLLARPGLAQNAAPTGKKILTISGKIGSGAGHAGVGKTDGRADHAGKRQQRSDRV